MAKRERHTLHRIQMSSRCAANYADAIHHDEALYFDSHFGRRVATEKSDRDSSKRACVCTWYLRSYHANRFRIAFDALQCCRRRFHLHGLALRVYFHRWWQKKLSDQAKFSNCAIMFVSSQISNMSGKILSLYSNSQKMNTPKSWTIYTVDVSDFTGKLETKYSLNKITNLYMQKILFKKVYAEYKQYLVLFVVNSFVNKYISFIFSRMVIYWTQYSNETSFEIFFHFFCMMIFVAAY